MSRKQLEEALEHAPIASVELALGAFDDAAIRGGVVEFCMARGIEVLAHAPRFVSDHSYNVYLSHMLLLRLCVLSFQALASESTHVTLFSVSVVLGIPLALATAVLSDHAKHRYQLLQRSIDEALSD